MYVCMYVCMYNPKIYSLNMSNPNPNVTIILTLNLNLNLILTIIPKLTLILTPMHPPSVDCI